MIGCKICEKKCYTYLIYDFIEKYYLCKVCYKMLDFEKEECYENW